MASKDDHKSKNKNSASSPKTTKKTKKTEAKAPVEPENRKRGLKMVGIGASAGGLEALQSFFEALPPETGMAFVVITHLHPEHESHMAELLQKYTRMPAMQVTKRTQVEANHVYVIPPNRSILMTNTHLDTREFEEPHGRRTPVDFFFRSMAASGHTDRRSGRTTHRLRWRQGGTSRRNVACESRWRQPVDRGKTARRSAGLAPTNTGGRGFCCESCTGRGRRTCPLRS